MIQDNVDVIEPILNKLRMNFNSHVTKDLKFRKK